MGAALECKGAMQYEAKETHLIHTKTSPDRLSMLLEDIDTICPGCKTPFSTGRGLMSHIRQTLLSSTAVWVHTAGLETTAIER